MRRLCKTIFPLAASLFIPSVYAAGLNVSDIKIDLSSTTVGKGIVWQSDTAFKGTVEFRNYIFSVKEVSLVMTPQSGAGSLNHDQFVQLPIDIDGKGLKLGFLGTMNGKWGTAPLSWKADKYPNSVTNWVTTSGATGDRSYWAFASGASTESAKKGQIEYELWPIIFCSADQCTVPSKISLDSLYLRLYSVNFSFDNSEPIINGGTIEIKSTCTFNVNGTEFSGINVTKQSAGTLLKGGSGEFKTNVSASCSFRDTAGTIYARLTPYQGIYNQDSRIGQTSLDGIGLIYRINDVPTSVNKALEWDVPQTFGTLSKDSISGDWGSNGSIYWGIYQYKDAVSPGPFRATVNYNFWID